MNPDLKLLQAYPFERLRSLLGAVSPQPTSGRPATEIKLQIGEPQHATPSLIKEALADNLAGLAKYPTTLGTDALRETIAAWICRRYELPAIDPATQVLPVCGSREALFSFAQAVVDPIPGALVASPNPFYQIYEGAALLAGAQPVFLNAIAENGFALDWEQLDAATWSRVQLLYVCSPGNPTGQVMTLDAWRTLFELADRYKFIIAADECYSEVHSEHAAPPLGALSAARQLGRDDFRRLVVFSSLSKRSNVPGLRSGFVAGDATLLKQFLLYRTYHGSAMSLPVQSASIAAWNDETHVIENRRLYDAKFAAVTPLISNYLPCSVPEAGFYLWADTTSLGLTDTEFTLALHRAQNVLVLPGSYLGREAHGRNPGANRVRLALVAEPDACLEAAQRIVHFCESIKKGLA